MGALQKQCEGSPGADALPENVMVEQELTSRHELLVCWDHASQIVRVCDLVRALLEGACDLHGCCMDGLAHFRIVEPHSKLPTSATKHMFRATSLINS